MISKRLRLALLIPLCVAGCSPSCGARSSDSDSFSKVVDAQVDGWNVTEFALSPDGTKVAFIGVTEGPGNLSSELLQARVGGAQERRLTVDGVAATAVAWFPDSRTLILASGPFEEEKPSKVEVLGANGERREIVLSVPLVVRDIAVAPTGEYAVISAHEPDERYSTGYLWRLDLVTGGVLRLEGLPANESTYLNVSFASSSLIVFAVQARDIQAAKDDFWVASYDVLSGDYSRLTPGEYLAASPSVIARLGVVVFSTTRQGGYPSQLRCMSLRGGSGIIEVIDAPAGVRVEATPDGKHLLSMVNDRTQQFGRTIVVERLPRDLGCGNAEE